MNKDLSLEKFKCRFLDLDALRGDKDAIYRASNYKFDKLMKQELANGKAQISEAIKHAQKFEQGAGRGGK